MKRDQYIPHEVSMRNTSEVMNLIENEGMTGYGIYWALMEYLRTQDNYVGDTKVLKSLARQLKTKLGKVESVLRNYGLFTITDDSFCSQKLDAMMRPLENKRKAMEKQNDSKVKSEQNQIACNVLKINNDVSLSKVKKSKVSSSKEEKGGDDGGAASVPASVSVSVPTTQAWERYIDELLQEKQWIEVMAMRSGLGLVFVNRFPEVLRLFKLHVQAVGNEKDIQSPGDAKRYFCFFNTPGSAPFRQLMAELQKPVDKGKYRYEDNDPATGQRSYCGVPIPPEAPPKPNAQAVWNGEKWVY